MDALKHLDKDNTMLVNVIHHRATKDTNWKDYLDIIYKDLRTKEKKVITIDSPEMDIYFVKEEARDFEYNKSFIELENLEQHTCKFKDLPFYIANQAGPEYMNFIKDAIQKRNRGTIPNIHKYRYVFGSDYDIENWYRIWWYLNMDNNKPKPLTKQFLDIEVDSIDVEGFPKPGECEINAVTIVDENDLTSFTFLMRNDKNPLIQEFEENIDDFVKDLHEAFDDTYGELEYRIYMYDDERELIKDMFKLINTMKRDFLLIWNMGFDIPYIIARMEELDMDTISVMCHKDFEVKELFYKKDMRNFMIQNKSDYFKISAHTSYIDQMLTYAGLRKGMGEQRSYALNAVAKKELDDEKLDYSEDANIKTLPYVDFKKFVMYNIKDVLLQLGIERKTDDISNLYLRSYTNATSYNKIFKQTIFLKNRAYLEFFKQGLMIGNNINVTYGVYDDDSADKEDTKKEKFDGAIVADPTLNGNTGIKMFGTESKYIFDNVVDMDFTAMYPHIIIAFNIAANCMVGKLVIDSDYKKIAQEAIAGKIDDTGKDFVDNMLTRNPALMGSKWFNLPDIDELDTLVRETFKINTKDQFNVDQNYADKYFVEKVRVNIKGVN